MTHRISVGIVLFGFVGTACVSPVGPKGKTDAGSAGGKCQFEVDCTGGQFCSTAGVCTTPDAGNAGKMCQFDVDCGTGEVCSGGLCAASDGGSSAGMDANNNLSGEDAGFGSYCETCAQDSDCGTGGYCITDQGHSFCSISCAVGSTTDCPSGAACFPTGENVDGSAPNRCFPLSGQCPAGSGTADGGTGMMGGFGRDGGRGGRGDGGGFMFGGDGGFNFFGDGGGFPPPFGGDGG